jgi:hypothetical protein
LGRSGAFTVEVFCPTSTVAWFAGWDIAVGDASSVVGFVEVIEFGCPGFTAPVAERAVG